MLALIPYLVVTTSVTLLLLLLSRGRSTSQSSGGSSLPSTFISRFNSIPIYVTMCLAWVSGIFFFAMWLQISSAYPHPPPQSAGILGAAYVVSLIAVSVLALPRIILRAFPVLRAALKERSYALAAIILSVSFAVVYLLLVKQIVVIGYNEPTGIPPPFGQYPYVTIFTDGPHNLFASFVYIPNIVIQVAPLITIYAIPFEMLFTIVLSILTSSAVVLAYYLVRNSSLKCCAKGAMMSTGGSILGLTATCPTCLVPSFVSVIFGGVAAAEIAYSNVYGAVLPPMLSVGALTVSLVYLSKKVKNETKVLFINYDSGERSLNATPTPKEGRTSHTRLGALWLGLFAIVASAIISYLSYFQPIYSPFNSYEAFASLLFWGAILGICFSIPLRKAAFEFLGYLKTVKGILIYVVYTSLHLIVYGFILEGIDAGFYPSVWGVPVQAGVVVSSQPLNPLSLVSLGADYFFNPNIVALVPPIFDVSLSVYSIVMAIIIGALVQVNIMKTIDMKKNCSLGRRSTVFLALPIIGVVGGASCCLSLPIFVTLLAVPTVSLATPSIISAYFLTYLLFPPATAVILKLNLDSINRMMKALSRNSVPQRAS